MPQPGPLSHRQGGRESHSDFASSAENPLVVLRGVFSKDQAAAAGAEAVKWRQDFSAQMSELGDPIAAVATPSSLLSYLHYPDNYRITKPASINQGIVMPGGHRFRQTLSVNRKCASQASPFFI